MFFLRVRKQIYLVKIVDKAAIEKRDCPWKIQKIREKKVWGTVILKVASQEDITSMSDSTLRLEEIIGNDKWISV